MVFKHIMPFMHGLIIFSALLLQGAAGVFAEDETITPRIEPAAACFTTPMTIVHDPEMKFSMGFLRGDGELVYIADPVTVTLLPLYWQGGDVWFRADELYGVEYVEGIPHLVRVFQEPGDYEFIFTDNLHTEPENRITVRQSVTLFSNDHPDCPKYPLQ